MEQSIVSFFLIIAIIALVLSTVAFSALAYTVYKLYTTIAGLTKKGEGALQSSKEFLSHLEQNKTVTNIASVALNLGKTFFSKKNS